MGKSCLMILFGFPWKHVVGSPSVRSEKRPSLVLQPNNTTYAGPVFSLSRNFQTLCHKNIVNFAIKEIWDQNFICEPHGWIRFNKLGNFSASDFQIYPPRHLSKRGDVWAEDKHSIFLTIPVDYCIFRTVGWFTRRGSLFNCQYQYPLILPRGKHDMSLLIPKGMHNEFSGESKVRVFRGDYLLSALIPFNSAFSHAFTTGAAHIAVMLPLLLGTRARILIPSKGPLESLLTSWGVPSDKILKVRLKAQDLYFSNASALVLRRPPFNIIQAHWPARLLVDLRDITVQWLRQNGKLPREATPSNLILYLWREGDGLARGVVDQQALVDQIARALRPEYELYVWGKEQPKIAYASEDAHTAWQRSAHLFVRAAAVIGPHGGAFGNIFLCAPNTTVIEFNIPWTIRSANGAAGNNTVRDMFYATARGLGITDYWYVWPRSAEGVPYHTLSHKRVSSLSGALLAWGKKWVLVGANVWSGFFKAKRHGVVEVENYEEEVEVEVHPEDSKKFYEAERMRVNVEEVVEILTRAGFCTQPPSPRPPSQLSRMSWMWTWIWT